MKKESVTITYRQEKQINTLHFTYDALGNKLQKTVTAFGTTTTTDYANGLLYKNGQLQFVSHSEGYLEPKANGTLEYVYQYTDHLGNIRLSYKKGSSDELIVVEENNYYPFGLRHEGYNNLVDGEENPYRYNGKELNEELGLGWYDYGARFGACPVAKLYGNPALARWMVVDPLAEKYAPWSPYNYVLGNPVRLIDPDGRSVDMPDDWYRNKKTKEVIWLDSQKEYDGYENLGYHYTETDGWGNRTHYNGDTRTKYVNFEPVKNHEENAFLKTANFITDNIVSSVVEGVQIVGVHIPRAAGKLISLQIEDVKNGGDGTNLRGANMKMPIYGFQNGRLLKTDLNEYSSGEVASRGVSALTAPINVVRTGLSGFFGKASDFIINNGVIGYFTGKTIEKLDGNNK